MRQRTISLCMIVKNEEKYLEKCLASIQDQVDEIIIVDTGSIDRTINIAKEYGAKIYHFTWIDDFAAARNYALEQALSDYVLVLDADEYLDENVDLQQDLLTNKDYYIVKHINYYSDGYTSSHHNVRLFKRGIGLSYFGKLHEHLNISDPNFNFSGAQANFIVHHVGYTIESYIEKDKKNRNKKLMELEVKDNPSQYSFFNYGKTLFSEGKYNEAIEAFKSSYGFSKYNSNTKELILYTSRCLSALGKNEEAIEILQESIKSFPEFTDMYFELGSLYENIRYFKDAEMMYKKCLDLGDASDYTSIIGLGGFLGHFSLARLYSIQKRHVDAFDAAYNSIQNKKNYIPALTIFISSMMKVNISNDETFEYLLKVYQINNKDDYKNIVQVLYNLRHSLLYRFISEGSGQLNPDIKAVALQYAKKYTEALEQWKQVDSISVDNAIDLLLLSIILKNEELLNKTKRVLNLREKDWKIIRKVLLQEDIIKINLSEDILKLLIVISQRLIILEEYDLFQYISLFILNSPEKYQIILSDLLFDNGYIDTSLDLLLGILQMNPNNINALHLMGDIYFIKGLFNESLEMYKKCVQEKEEYIYYERLLLVLQQLNETDKINILKASMMEKFPLSKWLFKID